MCDIPCYKILLKISKIIGLRHGVNYKIIPLNMLKLAKFYDLIIYNYDPPVYGKR